MRQPWHTCELVLVLLSSLVRPLSAFSLGGRFQEPRSSGRVAFSHSVRHHRGSYALYSSSSSESNDLKTSVPSVVVVSPPGGVGEVSAVKAASMGSSVRWFVVTNSQNPSGGAKPTTTVTLSSQALDTISQSGGTLQLAGATVSSVLVETDDPTSALPAVSAWCAGAAASDKDSVLICTFDGIDDAIVSAGGKKRRRGGASGDDEADANDPTTLWRNAVKIVAKEASNVLPGTRIAILSATEDDEPMMGDEDSEEDSGNKGGIGVGNIVGSLFGGKKPPVPTSLTAALSRSSGVLHKLRHGELFGTPESSPEFSPLVGGPRRMPDLCEEYTMRSVRVDPTLSVSGNLMMGSSTRSSRHAVGEAAALLALQKVKVDDSLRREGLDVCVSSLLGSDVVSVDAWDQEFQRVQSTMAASSLGERGQGAPLLFSAEFASVPDVKRLADWLATKWAPAILRTYDIAAIRVGARPVYAARVGENVVGVVWQQLVDFNSVTVGKMVITVSDTGLVATRGSGDPAKGFGSVSRKPLAGEDVLVRRLADAVAQAMEKGLARKPTVSKPKEVPVARGPVTSIQSSGTVEAAEAAAASAAAAATAVMVEPTSPTNDAATAAATQSAEDPASRDQGPRQSGARRSTERPRGKRRRDGNPPKP